MKQIQQLFLLGACLLGPVAWAQSPRDMIVIPWPEGRYWAQTVDDVMIFETGHTKGSDLSTSIFRWDSIGRIRFDRDEADPRWMVGYRILNLDVDSELANVHSSYWDIALAVGHKFDRLANGWQLSLAGGAGTANDAHFDDADAIYGLATLNAGKELTDKSSLNIGLQFDGNRSVFPDFPFPYLVYNRRVNDNFGYTLGIPINGFKWRPFKMVTLQVSYLAPVSGAANLSVWFSEQLSLFAEFESDTDGFHIDGVEHRRMFYSNRHVSGGIRWITKWADLSLSVGYAFDQEFERGFDLRNTDNVADLSDGPFAGIKVRGTF